MLIKDLLNKKILVWGYGIEGQSAVDFLQKHNYNKTILVATPNKIEQNINNVQFIAESEIENYDFDFVIKSSGISLYKDKVKQLQQRNIEISSILNIFLTEAQNKHCKIIGITGTKGKSTTTSVCYFILQKLGYKVAIAGNIGIPVLNLIDNIDKYDYICLELSSYQTAGLKYNVDYGVVLNLFPEHIDWHLTHENYYKDKLNILNFAKNKIVNYSDNLTQKFLQNSNYLYFNAENGFYVSNGFVYFKNDKIIDINKVESIHGEHIFGNLCAVLTILQNENIDFGKVENILRDFKTLEHRLEVFYNNKKRNIIYVNDSIATIPEATLADLKSFENYEHIRLVLGGFERQQDFAQLINYIKQKQNIDVYLVGTTGKRLINMFDNSKYFNSYDDLVNSIKQNILDNTAIILSPASPSFDMFKKFEERGTLFKTLMLK